MGELTYLVLGGFQVLKGRQVQPLKAAKPRRLLATLLLHPNRFVSTDLIADVLWEDAPPQSAVANIRTYVRVLRELLGGDVIETLQSGYRIGVETEALDATQLEDLVARASALREKGDHKQALAVYAQAHRLWRGRPLEDLPLAPAWDGAVTRLERLHRQATDELIALRLATADHAGAVRLLRERLTEDPYDEDLWAHLVRCLLATGRHHEASAAYEEAVRTLADELDVEPGEALRHAGKLTKSGLPLGPVEVAPPKTPARTAPNQLPLDVPDFTGREDELRLLNDLPRVTVISGAPGAGKTALAVHIGHLMRDVFTDGQVYLDMRAAGQPRDPSSALFELLRSLGTPDSAIPHDIDRRSAVLRSELASRRVLVLLDDVGTAGQVTPLLPGTGASALLITSRQRLTDLAGAVAVHLDMLDAAPAVELLRRIAGADRVDPGDAATADIVSACGNLPLAIRIAASRLVQRQDLTASCLARRLHDERHRLDELSLGELAVRSSADVSYRALRPAEARLYRLIGLLGTGDFPAWALEPLECERGLDNLIEANLVQVTGTARYRMHDLLRLHARELDADGAHEDLAVVLDGWVQRSRLMAACLPYRFFGVHDPAPLVGEPVCAEDALAWFEAEQRALTPLLRAAAEQELHEPAWRLAAAWAPYFDLQGPYDDWREAHEAGLASAQACSSARGEAILLRDLGQLALYRDDWPTAHAALTRSRELFGSIGDVAGFGVATAGLGTWHREQGMPEEAMRWFEEALAAFVEAGDAYCEAVARNAIASIWLLRKEPDAAAAWLAEAHDVAVRADDRHRQGQVLRRIAEMQAMRGDVDAAVASVRSALTIFEDLQDERCAAVTRVSLSEALMERGDPVSARRMLLDVLAAAQRLGDRIVEAQAASRLGQLHQTAGRTPSAREYFTRALRAWQFVANHERAAEVREHLLTLR